MPNDIPPMIQADMRHKFYNLHFHCYDLCELNLGRINHYRWRKDGILLQLEGLREVFCNRTNEIQPLFMRG